MKTRIFILALFLLPLVGWSQVHTDAYLTNRNDSLIRAKTLTSARVADQNQLVINSKANTALLASYQPLNAKLTAIAALSNAAGALINNGSGVFSFQAFGTGSVTGVSVVNANGVSGSVANSTTTPAITLTLGAITPTSVNGVPISGSSTPTLTVSGTTSVSGTNTGDQTTITGNAGTATALATGRTIGITGDITYTSPTFNGSSNITASSTVTKINGTSLSGLATGILKNTTTTGAPSIAVGSDLPTMTATVGGAVPTPPNNTTTFLRGDGTFATPSGGGSPGGSTTQVQFNSSGSFAGSSWNTWNNTSKFIQSHGIQLHQRGNSNLNLIEIPTINSVSPDTPTNYGSFWFTKYDSLYKNSNGVWDAIMQWGYNQNGSGNVQNSASDALWFALESDFDPTGSNIEHDFELHVEGKGNVTHGAWNNRYSSLVVNKANGVAYSYNTTDYNSWYKSNDHITPYFGINKDGSTNIYGYNTSSYLNITNSGGTAGNIRISTDNIGGTNISNQGTGLGAFSGVWSFPSPTSVGLVLTMPSTTGALGYSVLGAASTTPKYPFVASISNTNTNFMQVENTSATSSANAVVKILTASGGGDPSIVLYDNNGVYGYVLGQDQSDGHKFKIGDTQPLGTGVTYLTIDHVTGGMGIGTTSPTATLHLKAGTATAGTAPIKLTSGTNLTTSETGVMEYNGTDLLFTPVGTNRLTVFTGYMGQTTLVSGTKGVTVNGVGAGSFCTVTLVTPTGVTLTTQYQCVCTSNTITIQANVAAGTINVADGSVINYMVKP